VLQEAKMAKIIEVNEEKQAQVEAVRTRLRERGILKEIPPPITDLSPYRNRTPIEVHGQPLSELIIQERR
jgi:hypothetical protein